MEKDLEYLIVRQTTPSLSGLLDQNALHFLPLFVLFLAIFCLQGVIRMLLNLLFDDFLQFSV